MTQELERVLRPARKRLYDAQKVVYRGRTWTSSDPTPIFDDDPSIFDPTEAWEALATHGVIPEDWVEHPSRLFQCARCEGAGWHDEGPDGPRNCMECARPCPMERLRDEHRTASCHVCNSWGEISDGEAPHPLELEACISLAADVPGILAAEAIALEVTGALGLKPLDVLWVPRERASFLRQCYREADRWLTTPGSLLDPLEDVQQMHWAELLGLGKSEEWLLPTTRKLVPRLRALQGTGYALERLTLHRARLVYPADPSPTRSFLR